MLAFERRFLDQTITLAKRGGKVFPNPRVGAVVVKGGRVIAEGWHKKFGGPHAEVIALDALPAGAARGATVYVSLEPCADWKGKKTPSCAKRLVRERVKTVIVGMRDPNPHVRGKGIAILRKAGIIVTIAPPRTALYDVNHEYLMRIASESLERPFVLIKTAMSVDGKIGTPDHHRVALSTPEDRKAVDHLRARADAIMVGGTTWRNDKPRLTVKDSKLVRERVHAGRDPQPMKITIVGRKLFVDRAEYTLRSKAFKWADLQKAMAILAVRYGVLTLMLEGGGELNASMLQAGYVDLIRVAMAPVILGGRTAPTLVDGDGFADGIKLQCIRREQKGHMDIAWYAFNTGDLTQNAILAIMQTSY